MCIQCILLGPLVNAAGGADGGPAAGNGNGNGNGNDDDDDGASRFRCQSLAPFDFTPSPNEIRHIVDYEAASYLSETLRRYRTEHGLSLVPLSVESHGSCLPHAISRSLVGHEVYYDALRLDLTHELRDDAAWYERVLNVDCDGRRVYSPSDWRGLEWPRIVGAAGPTHGLPAPEGKWLGPEHVLGFANLLGRPILLLNTPSAMRDLHHGNRGGLFPPLRRTRDDIMKNHGGNFPSPIVLGYANEAGDHYVALVRTRSRHSPACLSGPAVRDFWDANFGPRSGGARAGRMVPLSAPLRLPRPDDTAGGGAEEVVVDHPATGRGIHVVLPPPSCGDDTGDHRDDDSSSVTVTEVYPRWASLLESGVSDLLAMNGPRVRSRTLRVLRDYCRNVIDARDGGIVALGGGTGRGLPDTIPLDGAAGGCRWITGVPGATDVLKSMGYRRDGGRDGDRGGPCLRLVAGGPPICHDAAEGVEDEEATTIPRSDSSDANPLCGGARPRPGRSGAFSLASGNGGTTAPCGGGERGVEIEEEELRRRLEGLPSPRDPTPLRHILDVLDGLAGADASDEEATCGGAGAGLGEVPGGHEHHGGRRGDDDDDDGDGGGGGAAGAAGLLGTVPRYSWLGVGPPALVDAGGGGGGGGLGRERIPPWPGATSPTGDDDGDGVARLLWGAARSHYGSGLLYRPDDVWSFGNGEDSTEYFRPILVELRARFYTLTRGAFGEMPAVLDNFRGGRADFVVICPTCQVECDLLLTTEMLSILGDGLCDAASCPNPDCGALLDLNRTYRNCLADAVASAARGSLGGVWRCRDVGGGGDGMEDFDWNERGVEEDPSPGGGVGCGALNVGHSSHCVACGAPKPAKRAPRLGPGDEASVEPADIADRDEETEARMLELMIKVLSESLPPTAKRKRSISTATVAASSLTCEQPIIARETSDLSPPAVKQRRVDGEEEEQEQLPPADASFVSSLDIFHLPTVDERYPLMGMQDDVDPPLSSDGKMPPKAFQRPPSLGRRGVSCPVGTLSIRPKNGIIKAQKARGNGNTLRTVGVQAGPSSANVRASGREVSEPITRRELVDSQERVGVDLRALTRNAALALLKSQ